MAEITVTKDNFETEVLGSHIPVLVDFWASWCGPCKMLAPVLAQVAAEKEGQVKVAKINVDEEADLAQRYGIRSIPTLMLFREGELKETSLGFIPKEKIEALIAQ
ncbi:MAG: thioredoxin [Lachnospiraceae bacterium]|nr:thioredoxin [Lachnospiraceae bacterium]